MRDLDAIDRIIQASDDAFETPQERDAAMYALREPTFNVGRLTYTYEWIQRLVWGQAMSDLRGPAWLAIAGIVLAIAGIVPATLAGAWPIWIQQQSGS
ncbi:hypothetical protein AB0I82_23695 [Streptomyces sp. NPDC050315]|uniref:hypothetical protein n=1 Tax=Streptomyces sp. NPDC050315 TaxID=3155039 RepID=UPI0034225623